MNIIIVSNYYPPELGAAANRICNLAEGLVREGNNVSVVCPLPNYPTGKIFKEYQGRFYCHEKMSPNLEVHRYWIYPSVSKNPFMRAISMLSFAVALWLFIRSYKAIHKADWVIIQNSPLLVSYSSIILFGKLFAKKIALNISDLWPLSALELGAINRGRLYSILEYIELFNHKNSNLIIGQSQEILDHARGLVTKKSILYRNIQPRLNVVSDTRAPLAGPKKIIYAGLLGVAQGVLGIVQQIDFSKYGIEFHIYGDGNEMVLIQKFIDDHPNRGVKFFGAISKKELDECIGTYHASIVPLVREIKGAVPSKIFELADKGVPIIFSGGGEGARLVEQYGLGFTVPPGDHSSLQKMIEHFSKLPDAQVELIRNKCKSASETHFNFDDQLSGLIDVLESYKD